MTQQPQPLPLKVSQKARDAAADLAIARHDDISWSNSLRKGDLDDSRFAQAFAAFERDLTAPSGEGDVELFANLERLKQWCRAQDANATIWLHSDEAIRALASTATKLAEVERERDEAVAWGERLRDLMTKPGQTLLASEQAFRRRAEEAESRLAQAVAALIECDAAIKEMFRYYDGGETRGSYDGKPERNQLRKAGYVATVALTSLKGTPDAQ